MTNYAAALAAQFHLKEQQTAKLIELIDAGNTIPFIARYRKEEHGSLDDQTIRTVYERLQYLRNLDTRKAEVRELIEGTENLTPEIEKNLTNAATLAEIDDIYRPFRPKRKTRAGMAKERGLEPLAKKILAQEKGVDPMRFAEGYVNAEKGCQYVGRCTERREGHHRGDNFRRCRYAPPPAHGCHGARRHHEPRRKGRGFRVPHVL